MVKTRAGSSAGPNENMVVSEELKSYLNEQFHNLADKKDITEMKQEIMALVTSMMEKITSLETNINVLESKNAILESHIAHLKSNQESHEQYSRRLCLRIDGIGFPEDSNQETSENVLQKVKHVFTEIGVDVPDTVIDRAHRIGPKSSRDGKAKQQVIVRLTTWRHRTAVYRARKKSSKVKIRLDLTKPRLNLINAANDLLKEYSDSFAFADVNCRPRVKFKGKFSFFESIDDVKALTLGNT
eukprot:gene10407-19108_t